MGRRSQRRRRRAGIVAGGILVVAALAVAWLALTLGPLNGAAQAAAPAPTATPLIPTPVLAAAEPAEPAAPAAPPVAWVIGDSQAAATGSWVIQALTALGYDVRSSAVGGIGFVAGVPAHPGIRDSLENDLYDRPADPDVVIVQAGGNDQVFPLPEVHAAAADAFVDLTDLAPEASVVVVGPLVQVEAWASERRAVSGVLQDLAAAHGFTFVDTSRWVETSALQPYLIDDRHFSPEGHAKLRDLFLSDLAAAGFTLAP